MIYNKLPDQPMTVADLRKIIRRLPPDMIVIETRQSDYGFMKPESWSVIDAVSNSESDEWLMRTHESMPPELKAKTKKYLHFSGN